jgi:cupin fold WbuC family metalloprotein
MQWITHELFERVLEQARQSPRRRMNFNFHAGLDENPHRFLNVLVEGTYIRPHRHLDPPKTEAFLALEGEIAFFVFDDSGNVETRRVLGRHGLWGVDIPPGVWHSMAVLTPHAVCYEVKPGPYTPLSDKEFAPWAPAEDAAEAAAYLQALIERRCS